MPEAAAGTEEYAANLALGHLGQPAIALMAENSTRARAVRQFFAVARDTALRLKWWNFATAWVVPAMDPVAGIHPTLTKRYTLPDDCVRVRFVDDSAEDEWAIESGLADVGGVQVETTYLVSSLDAPKLCYTRRVSTVRLWDPLFQLAFSYVLASLACRKLGRDEAFADSLMAKARDVQLDAGGIDSKEKAREGNKPEPSYLSARRGVRRRG